MCHFSKLNNPESGRETKSDFSLGSKSVKNLRWKKKVRDLSRPTMSLAPVIKPFKRPILQEQFIKGFIKLGDQMCELNYKETKIKIEVKLRDQKYNFTYKK